MKTLKFSHSELRDCVKTRKFQWNVIPAFAGMTRNCGFHTSSHAGIPFHGAIVDSCIRRNDKKM
ncbi:MAG: hypothetical protein NT007_02175 [Candidatus Kapabacteria bacterium]|nr:hypothetical protein [Candidatus Kapabacteria bacterium]